VIAHLRRLAILLVALGSATLPLGRVEAQAFTPPEGLGSLTLAWQYVDNTGHRFSDGLLRKQGESVSMSALLELEYGVSDRLAVTAGVPYVFAKYTGGLPPFSRLAIDACRCWHSGFQDFSLATRYRLGDDSWAVTPSIRLVQPTHDYRYQGEAVVGRDLRETQLGVSAGWRLPGALRKASLQSGYAYSIVEKPIRDVSINRSNASLNLGYQLSDRLFVHGAAAWQKTHGGLRIGSPTGHPFFPPGELNTPERYAQRDRLLRVEYVQAGGGLAYSAGPVDLFFSVMKYVQGKNAHDGQVYTAGTTWYFDRSK
jgi:hypothetical protein